MPKLQIQLIPPSLFHSLKSFKLKFKYLVTCYRSTKNHALHERGFLMSIVTPLIIHTSDFYQVIDQK